MAYDYTLWRKERVWGSRGHVCVEGGVGGRATVFTVGPVYTQKGVVGIQRRGWGKGCALPGGEGRWHLG